MKSNFSGFPVKIYRNFFRMSLLLFFYYFQTVDLSWRLNPGNHQNHCDVLAVWDKVAPNEWLNIHPKYFCIFTTASGKKGCIFIPWNRWITHCITNILAKFICCWGLRLSVCAIWSRQSVISLPISSQVCAAVPLASLPTPQAIVQYIQPQNILNKNNWKIICGMMVRVMQI